MARPPKPTALHLLQGTDRPDRMNPHEPQPPVVISAKPPTWLKGRARKAWSDIAAILTEMKVLTVADTPALALLCDAWGEFIEAREVVRKKGMTYQTVTKSGYAEMKRPEVTIAADAWKRCMTALSQFGMTPSARAKVSTVGDEVEEDPFEKLLKRKEGKV